MDKIDLAWAAGFFDGEGCVLLRPSGKKLYALRITVSQVNPTPINKFQKLFGGHISLQSKRNPNWNQCWKWEQDCKSASTTLELLLPYLIVKKDVAEIALEYQKTKRKGRKITDVILNQELDFKTRISFLNKKD